MAPQIRKILFATDLTENSRHAYQYAAAMAERFSASIVMLHVIEKLPGGAQQMIDLVMGEDMWHQFREAREKNAKNVLIAKKTDDLVVRKAVGDFYGPAAGDEAQPSFDEYEIVLKDGHVAEEVAKVAEEYECQMIVMGSHRGLLGEI
ncbi:MAG: universal stress protein, partial [Deltaproteobacteria bacterium]|nr:universal stress protein [Deltaproteobacteria bacterium]